MKAKLDKKVTGMRSQTMTFSNDGIELSLSVPDTSDVKEAFESVIDTVVTQQDELISLNTNLDSVTQENRQARKNIVSSTNDKLQQLLSHQLQLESKLADARKFIQNFTYNMQGYVDEADTFDSFPSVGHKTVVKKLQLGVDESESTEVKEESSSLFPTEEGAQPSDQLTFTKEPDIKKKICKLITVNGIKKSYKDIPNFNLPKSTAARWRWALKKVISEIRRKNMKISMTRIRMDPKQTIASRLDRIDEELFNIPNQLEGLLKQSMQNLFQDFTQKMDKVITDMKSMEENMIQEKESNSIKFQELTDKQTAQEILHQQDKLELESKLNERFSSALNAIFQINNQMKEFFNLNFIRIYNEYNDVNDGVQSLSKGMKDLIKALNEMQFQHPVGSINLQNPNENITEEVYQKVFSGFHQLQKLEYNLSQNEGKFTYLQQLKDLLLKESNGIYSYYQKNHIETNFHELQGLMPVNSTEPSNSSETPDILISQQKIVASEFEKIEEVVTKLPVVKETFTAINQDLRVSKDLLGKIYDRFFQFFQYNMKILMNNKNKTNSIHSSIEKTTENLSHIESTQKDLNVKQIALEEKVHHLSDKLDKVEAIATAPPPVVQQPQISSEVKITDELPSSQEQARAIESNSNESYNPANNALTEALIAEVSDIRNQIDIIHQLFDAIQDEMKSQQNLPSIDERERANESFSNINLPKIMSDSTMNDSIVTNNNPADENKEGLNINVAATETQTSPEPTPAPKNALIRAYSKLRLSRQFTSTKISSSQIPSLGMTDEKVEAMIIKVLESKFPNGTPNGTTQATNPGINTTDIKKSLEEAKNAIEDSNISKVSFEDGVGGAPNGKKRLIGSFVDYDARKSYLKRNISRLDGQVPVNTFDPAPLISDISSYRGFIDEIQRRIDILESRSNGKEDIEEICLKTIRDQKRREGRNELREVVEDIDKSVKELTDDLANMKKKTDETVDHVKEECDLTIHKAIMLAMAQFNDQKESVLSTKGLCLGCGRNTNIRVESISRPTSPSFFPQLSTGSLPGPDVLRAGFKMPVRVSSPPKDIPLVIRNRVMTAPEAESGKRLNFKALFGKDSLLVPTITSPGPSNSSTLTHHQDESLQIGFRDDEEHLTMPSLPLSQLPPINQQDYEKREEQPQTSMNSEARSIYRKGFPAKKIIRAENNYAPERIDLSMTTGALPSKPSRQGLNSQQQPRSMILSSSVSTLR